MSTWKAGQTMRDAMRDARMRDTVDMARTLAERLLAYGPGHVRLLIGIVRLVAQGRPITAELVDQRVVALGLDPDAAERFLRELTERDAHDQIIGAVGLSLGDHPHRLSVAGVSLSAWCALDTLFLPALLRQTATIVSPSPVTGDPIRLRVSPERVEAVDPLGATVSIVLVDPSREHMLSVEAMWGAFCQHVHFFAAREEAEPWASGRDGIAILTVDEGFELGRQAWSRVLAAAWPQPDIA
jgi:alkylmercury lyase